MLGPATNSLQLMSKIYIKREALQRNKQKIVRLLLGPGQVPKYHQEFQVPKMEVLTYISSM